MIARGVRASAAGAAVRGAVRACARASHARCAALAGLALLALCTTGCTSQMASLQGERTVVQWIAPAPQAPEVAEVPAIFTLKNATMGPIAVESMRVPVGVEASTAPPLPTSIKAGERLEVVVIAKFRRERGDSVRRIVLEAAGQPGLELIVEGKFKPSAPNPAAPAPATAAPTPAAATVK